MSWSNIFGGGGPSMPESWRDLDSEQQWTEVRRKSWEKPMVIFKHSTRCAISSAAKRHLSAKWGEENEKAEFWYLDLIRHRNISNRISSDLELRHESPQVIVVSKGRVFYHASHSGINASTLQEIVNV